MNKKIIIANWKMNPLNMREAQELFDTVASGVEEIEGVEVVVCPPFVYLPTSNKQQLAIKIGAQDCFWENEGAFTGEISPAMLRDFGCSYVILGHSERAKYVGETEEMVQKKVNAALAAGLKVVLCVGENEEVPKDADNLVVVYEPEWAISTEGGEAADTQKVASRVAEMRRSLQTTPILYGGSVDSSNIASFLKESNVQGALVGSASLDAKEFIELVRNAAM
jgi:triosephosphate isomerase (TIM)